MVIVIAVTGLALSSERSKSMATSWKVWSIFELFKIFRYTPAEQPATAKTKVFKGEKPVSLFKGQLSPLTLTASDPNSAIFKCKVIYSLLTQLGTGSSVPYLLITFIIEKNSEKS